MNNIFQTLEKLGLTSKQSRVLYSNRTRDKENLKVWKDSKSGVIYIDDFYIGNETYVTGSYRNDKVGDLASERPDFERNSDAQRRFSSNLEFVAGKKIVDFGCGSGDFLKLVQPYCTEATGVDLQQNYLDELNANGILCTNDIETIEDNSLDRIVSFHVLEHLPDPIKNLSALKRKIVSGGQILIEVPHAKDFLLSSVECEKFKQFTLWNQHLILHTRESLQKMLEFVGFKEIKIKGVQRYPLSNHLYWLSEGKPRGHKSQLSSLDSENLVEVYQNSLSLIDATDTLVAIAKVP